MVSQGNNSETSSSCNQVVQPKPKNAPKKCVKVKDHFESLCKKPENLMQYEAKSDISTDGGFDLSGNHQAKLNNVIDKLQDHDW